MLLFWFLKMVADRNDSHGIAAKVAVKQNQEQGGGENLDNKKLKRWKYYLLSCNKTIS